MTLGPIQKIPVNKIKCGTDIRDNRDPSKVAGLKITMKSTGQLVPVIVWYDGEWFYVLDGHGRYFAALDLGQETLDAQVLDKPPSRGEALKQAVILNTQRESIAPLTLAQVIADLREEACWTASEVAVQLGLSNTTVSRLLASLSWPESIKDRVHSGELAFSTACELAKVADPVKQDELTKAAVSGQLTRDAASSEVKREKNSDAAEERSAATRIVATLGSGRTVSVSGAGLSLDSLIAWLEELLSKARKARTRGLEVRTFAKMLRDQTKAEGNHVAV